MGKAETQFPFFVYRKKEKIQCATIKAEKDIEEKSREKKKKSILLKKESYELLKDANGGKYPKEEMEEKYKKIRREAQKNED